MSFGVTSRADDLISLFYMLILMLKGEDNFWVGTQDPYVGKNTFLEIFHSVRAWKSQYDLKTIAKLFCKQFEFPVGRSNSKAASYAIEII